MDFADRGSACCRRVMMFIGIFVATLVAAPAARAQDAQDQFQFTTPRAWVLWQVKADRASDFESSWMAIKNKLAASDKPEHKTVADSIKIYRPEAPPQDVPGVGQMVIYYFVIDPASQTQSYNPTALLYETGDLFPRDEADAIFNNLKEALLGIDARPLRLVQ